MSTWDGFIQGKMTHLEYEVGQATILTGLERQIMREDHQDRATAKEMSLPQRILFVMTYPDILWGTKSIQGVEWPLPFDQFLLLPEELINAWRMEILQANPHWRTRIPEPQEKKSTSPNVTTSSDALPPTTTAEKETSLPKSTLESGKE